MDNLRTIIIALVVLYHAGGVYESTGMWGWFWIVDDPDIWMASGIIGIMFDTFVMPAIFFIAGYLAAASINGKTAWGFIKGKAKRLLLPWVLAIVTLIPLYKVIFLYSRGFPQENWTTYFHITNPNSQNWLWFLPMLFAFSLIYLGIDRLGINLKKINLVWGLIVGFLLSVGFSYLIGNIAGFRSWTLTPLIDFENERLLAHFLFYLFGAAAYKQNLFAKLPEKKTLYNIANGVSWLPVTGHIFLRIWPFFISNFEVTPLYRFLWFTSFHLSSIVMVYVMVESFRFYLNKSGKLWELLNRNSYGVYIIHVILIGIFGTLLLGVTLPGWAKYLILFVLTYAGSNLMVSLYRRGKSLLSNTRAKLGHQTGLAD
ncbi:MAG TPA: acyltransferase [Anaerolineales bacterium]|nr:acyltransferase [Anaerolineales bacterium]